LQAQRVEAPAPAARKAAATRPELGTAIEAALWAKGFASIAGVDEAGRGPLAGPVVAAACIIAGPGVVIAGVMDSKATKTAVRERIYEELTTHPGVRYGVCAAAGGRGRRGRSTQSGASPDASVRRCVIEAAVIDRVNILQATMRAMEGAVAALPGPPPAAVLVDGNRIPPNLTAEHQECLVKGDARCYSIAAASIIAKVGVSVGVAACGATVSRASAL